ncbi:hypothetical protein JCM30237_28000 [Halolamina litorea]|uniref:Uncharacterized protein n=1 Tax=Halolamina litorea TaxID=1515593 RepID=A0ABD6BU34_9EURY|nr:hypothetical protein [Halolamina litorea]
MITLLPAHGVAPAAPLLPLQTVTGGSTVVVLAALLALLVATVLSLAVAARLYGGYRRGGGRAMLGLLVGLVLLTTVPFVLRMVLTNVGDVSATTRALAATSSQLAGLLIVLTVVFDRG